MTTRMKMPSARRVRAKVVAAGAILAAGGVVQAHAQEWPGLVGSTPEAFGRYMKSEPAKWCKVIQQAGIKPQ